jgi:hypothetical protein
MWRRDERGLTMPMFMDVHYHAEDLTPEFREWAHALDMQATAKHGVTFVKYWFDEATGRVFCLWEAPTKDAALAVHRDSHGVLADEIWEVKEVS